jgi:hypothetical protein
MTLQKPAAIVREMKRDDETNGGRRKEEWSKDIFGLLG